MVAPAGAPASSEKVMVFVGMSLSVAIAVKVMAFPTEPDCAGMVVRVGAEFTSLTVTLIVSLSVLIPSETRISMG